tara:strand:+ start:513 stop:758 length:246 start_codon:yes stop_codon:yes gene_type:complete
MIVSNGDMPVNQIVMEDGHLYHASQVCFENAPLVSGLTKREAFAMAAMQGILSHAFGRGTKEELAVQSLACADALLKELAK